MANDSNAQIKAKNRYLKAYKSYRNYYVKLFKNEKKIVLWKDEQKDKVFVYSKTIF